MNISFADGLALAGILGIVLTISSTGGLIYWAKIMVKKESQRRAAAHARQLGEDAKRLDKESKLL